jgi:hypothetical protein
MLAGGLCLVGRSILIRFEPEGFRNAVRRAEVEHIPLYEAEALECGVAQHMVGGFALGLWGFESTSIAGRLNHPLRYVHLARAKCAASPLVERISPTIEELEPVCSHGAAVSVERGAT